MTFDSLSNEIFSRYGAIKRARGHFLYTEKGVRLTDLYRDDGRAILGWRNGNALLMMKNSISRGMTGTFKTFEDYRLEKAVSELLGSKRKIYIFSDLEKAILASAKFDTDSFAIYKPWTWEKIESYIEKKVVVLEPPFPWGDGIVILAVDDESFRFLSLSKEQAEPIAGSTGSPTEPTAITAPIEATAHIAPPLAAAITRSIYDLIAAKQNLSEKDFFRYDKILTKFFERKGPYLFPKKEIAESEEKYDDFVARCLEAGVVVNPNPKKPSIVPFGVEEGVFRKLC